MDTFLESLLPKAPPSARPWVFTVLVSMLGIAVGIGVGAWIQSLDQGRPISHVEPKVMREESLKTMRDEQVKIAKVIQKGPTGGPGPAGGPNDKVHLPQKPLTIIGGDIGPAPTWVVQAHADGKGRGYTITFRVPEASGEPMMQLYFETDDPLSIKCGRQEVVAGTLSMLFRKTEDKAQSAKDCRHSIP